jgi:DNA-directed RNA polymerase subunit N (RpoN/RPB10)
MIICVRCFTCGKVIGNKWEEYEFGNNKFQDKNINYKVWTNLGWTKINRIIKHKTNKKIYEIFTKNSYVQVTEDHSLLNEKSEIIKPNECKINSKLLQRGNV